MTTREKIRNIFDSISPTDLTLMKESIRVSLIKNRRDIESLEGLAFDADAAKGKVMKTDQGTFDISSEEGFTNFKNSFIDSRQQEASEFEALNLQLNSLFNLHHDLWLELHSHTKAQRDQTSKSGLIISTKEKVIEIFSSIPSCSFRTLKKAIEEAINIYIQNCENIGLDLESAQKLIAESKTEEAMDGLTIREGIWEAGIAVASYKQRESLEIMKEKLLPLFDLVDDYREDDT